MTHSRRGGYPRINHFKSSNNEITIYHSVSSIASWVKSSNNGTIKRKVLEVKKSIYIDVPKEDLWKITADDFASVDKWISGVNLAEGEGTGVGAARICTPSYKGFKKTTEEIIDYQPKHSFTYHIAEGLPKMVAYGTNTWIHQSKGSGTTLTMHTKMELRGLMGFLMKGAMKKRMNTILQDALEELKVYAETGEQHERKIVAMRKFEANK